MSTLKIVQHGLWTDPGRQRVGGSTTICVSKKKIFFFFQGGWVEGTLYTPSKYKQNIPCIHTDRKWIKTAVIVATIVIVTFWHTDQHGHASACIYGESEVNEQFHLAFWINRSMQRFEINLLWLPSYLWLNLCVWERDNICNIYIVLKKPRHQGTDW